MHEEGPRGSGIRERNRLITCVWCWPSGTNRIRHCIFDSKADLPVLQPPEQGTEDIAVSDNCGLNLVESTTKPNPLTTLPRVPESRHRSRSQPVVTPSQFSFPTARFSPVVRLVFYTRGSTPEHDVGHCSGPSYRYGAFGDY